MPSMAVVKKNFTIFLLTHRYIIYYISIKSIIYILYEVLRYRLVLFIVYAITVPLFNCVSSKAQCIVIYNLP